MKGSFTAASSTGKIRHSCRNWARN